MSLKLIQSNLFFVDQCKVVGWAKKYKCSDDGWMNGSNGGWMELWIDEWMDGLRMQSRMDGWAGNI